MTIHSPASWCALGESLALPADSVQHGIAEFVASHSTEEGLDLVLALILEDGHTPAAVSTARRLVHVLADEAYDLRCAGHALTAAPVQS